MRNLEVHAARELARAGLFENDSDYAGSLGVEVMKLMAVFAAGDHSGGSAHRTLELFDRLARFKVLTPITADPCEWVDVSEMSGTPTWQNARQSSCLSTDGGKTYIDVDDEARTVRASEGQF